MVYQLTKFHVQRVDMVINPPWNLPFLGAKGLTSPEQTATGKGISNPFMAVMVCQKPYGIQLTNVSSTENLKNSCCKDKKRRLEVLKIKNNLKNSIYNILRKLKVFKVKIKNVLKELEVHNTKLSLANSNSYLRDILGDILGKDMYYPLTFVKPIRVSLVYKRNPKAQCYVVMSNNGDTVLDEKLNRGNIYGQNEFDWVAFKSNKSPMKSPVDEYDLVVVDLTEKTTLLWNAVGGAVPDADVFLQKVARVNAINIFGFQVGFRLYTSIVCRG
ncbi:hypothetical protein Tco_0699095 [Tanacetum coccineum]